ILHFVAGIDQTDARLKGILTPLPAPVNVMTATHAALAAKVADCLRAQAEPLASIEGDAQSRLDVALAASGRLGRVPLRLSAEGWRGASPEIDALSVRGEREARLSRIVLLRDASASAGAGARGLNRFLTRYTEPCIVLTQDPIETPRAALRFMAEKPAAGEQ